MIKKFFLFQKLIIGIVITSLCLSACLRNDSKEIQIIDEESYVQAYNEEYKNSVGVPNTVYITNNSSDKFYHRIYCKKVRKKKISITVEMAKKDGYQPCKKCHPGYY